ncbi:MAG: entericidin [Bacteroidales bacterium]|nr:entericidin [Bacteroidales bacterium]MBD5218187.1 entericidin [Bacteroidales bacterium]MBD5222108.1 entericidin [Bacteroidales bacterium]
MKKIVLSLAVLASIALVSCGDKKAETTADSDTVATEVVEDSAIAEDSAAAPADSAAATETPADSAK